MSAGRYVSIIEESVLSKFQEVLREFTQYIDDNAALSDDEDRQAVVFCEATGGKGKKKSFGFKSGSC